MLQQWNSNTTKLTQLKIINSPVCPVCTSSEETIQHILRDCHVVKRIWISFSHPSNFFNDDLLTYLEQNAKKKKNSKTFYKIYWSTIFLTTISTIWNSRNHEVFRNQACQTKLVTKLSKHKAIEFWTTHNHLKTIPL